MVRGWMLGLLLLVAVAGTPARAGFPPSVAGLTQRSVLAGADSLQLKLWAYLARGDIAGALVMYEAQTGQAPPAWLLELQSAYVVANQVAGRCQQVARTIHTAFDKLGRAPEYIAFKTNQQHPYMVFDLGNGKQASVTRNGYHVAVKLGDLIYDAYTGPLGMRLSDYLSRLHAKQGVIWEQVKTP
ncbi:hypothetical protein MEBOL_002755 [Melittangium boletus DSM 14713]|uniref:Lipoprotein n=2 Tax=Melittangium boletus TaxID=83453 RepID=A0A250IEC9_9BACT|nr:hypothetical protein MEBOL_002755 [Melittangium boletus DSM 14713]